MRTLFLLIFSLFFATFAHAQNPKLKELERKRKAAFEQIASINKELSINKKSAASSLKRIKLIETQIASRKKLIQLLNDELEELELQINKLVNEIQHLEVELNQKRDEYGKSVQLMFLKRSSYDQLMFVFSSNSLSQAYRRTRYLKEYAHWSREKGEEIMAQQKVLNAKKNELQKSRADKEMLVKMREEESAKLQTEQKKQKVVVKNLDKIRGELQTSLARQKKQAQALDQQIQRIIQDEIRKAQAEARRAQEEEDRRRELAAADQARKKDLENAKKRETEAANKSKTTTKSDKESTKKPEKSVEPEPQPVVSKPARTRKADTQGGYAMTKEEKTLSDDLSKNRGSLPVPITGRFRVVGHFGQQQHEDLKYVVTNNNGVDIQGDPGSDARAVFGGVVSKVFAVPGYNSSVIVRHGNFLTVYSNLSRVYVSAGDRVSTRQLLGKVYSDPDYDGQTILHFQIWKETSKQNPESWINF